MFLHLSFSRYFQSLISASSLDITSCLIPDDFDIMVEAKHKELAVIKYKEIHYNEEEEAVLGHA